MYCRSICGRLCGGRRRRGDDRGKRSRAKGVAKSSATGAGRAAWRRRRGSHLLDDLLDRRVDPLDVVAEGLRVEEWSSDDDAYGFLQSGAVRSRRADRRGVGDQGRGGRAAALARGETQRWGHEDGDAIRTGRRGVSHHERVKRPDEQPGHLDLMQACPRATHDTTPTDRGNPNRWSARAPPADGGPGGETVRTLPL